MSTLEKTFALLFVILALVLIYLLRPILLPFLVGIGLAYLGDPLVDRLESLKVGRTVGVLIVFAVFTLVIAGGLLVLVPMLIREVSGLVQDLPRFIAWLQQTTSPFLRQNFGVDPFDIKLEALRTQLAQNWQQAGGVAGQIVAEVTRSGLTIITWLVNLALIPVVAFYLMRDWDEVMAKLRGLIPRDTEDTVVRLVAECDEVLSAFLRGQLLVMFLLGCVYATGLYLVGLNFALIIGMLAGLASIVPYLGFAVGIVAAMAVAVFQFQDMTQLLYVAGVFAVGQLLEGMVFTPLLVGDRIGLHPVAVIFAVMAGGQLFGMVGILLALPVAAVIMVFVRHLYQRYKASDIYESKTE